ncbi:MAG TPA: hypothetical protein VLE91_02860 [Candidatus Saccharimonadales bacterium]|nr:hypothetical protein [Candidatus Saccharimonadales bacterium]
MSAFEDYLKSVGEVGNVTGSRGVIVYCSGLAGAKIWEKVIFENDTIGLVYSVGEDSTEILLLSNVAVNAGMMVARSNETLMATVSMDALGRTVDVFGDPVDGRGDFKKSIKMNLEAPAPDIIDRVRIDENLETGVTLIDLLIPIGKGQRQLIIGDQKTGKTSFLLQAIARQVQLGSACIYVAIGKKKSDLASAAEKLAKLGALSKTIIIAAPSSTPSSLIYMAPFCAMSYAEFLKTQGLDVLVVMDEISRHAKYYRELSILSRRMPGRDGYPGDIFYMHSHLLERAGRFLVEGTESSKSTKGKEGETLTLKIKGNTGSITCLPVVETIGSDFTGYIQTNLMSMTDGHIFFDTNKFQEGLRPAVNIGISVTRVGKQTQNTIERELAEKVREVMFAYTKAVSVAKFGVELLEATRRDIVAGERLNAVFDQGNDVLVPRVIQLLLVQLLTTGFWNNSTPVEIAEHKEKIMKAYDSGKMKNLLADVSKSIDSALFTKFVKTVGEKAPEVAKICGIEIPVPVAPIAQPQQAQTKPVEAAQK